MQYTTLGLTGVQVSVIGFGCGGNAALMVSDDEELRLATLERALETGINYFDTAPVYGNGTSEANLGRGLSLLKASAVVSTKVVLQAGDLADPAAAIRRQVADSLGRLERDRIDILVLHNRVFETPDGSDFGVGVKLGLKHVLGPGGVADAFADLVADGTITVGGFTALGGDISAICTLIDSGAFGVMNVSMSLLNPSAAVSVRSTFTEPNYCEIANRAGDRGIGVMAIQALARGALTGTGPTSERGAAIARAALRFDSPLSIIATRYVLGKRGVSTAILGFSRPEHVDEAVTAVARGRLSVDIEDALDMVATSS